MSAAAGLAHLASGFQPVIGSPISIRPLRAEDIEIEAQFIRGLSARALSQRLLGGARKLTREYLEQLTRPDYPRELALAAVVLLDARETIIGVARYAQEPGGCEFALVVADAWQRCGIGKMLLQRLIEAAQAHGLEQMSGYVLSDNSAMLGLARSLGFARQRVAGDATLTRVNLALAPPQAVTAGEFSSAQA